MNKNHNQPVNHTKKIIVFLEKYWWVNIALILLTAFLLLLVSVLLAQFWELPIWLKGLAMILLLSYLAYGLKIPVISNAAKLLIFVVFTFMVINAIYTNVYCQFINPNNCIKTSGDIFYRK